MSAKSYDTIVIGGGPGGYVAGIRLGQLKQKALVIEKEYMGGVCLNWGCIPSKALISATGLVEKIRHSADMGISVESINVDVAKLQAWKEGIVRKLTGGVQSLVKNAGTEIVMGSAKLTSPNTVTVTKPNGKTEDYRAEKGIIIATGATPIRIPGFDVDGKVVITAREAVSLERAPKSMVVIGGGVIGMELGMVYQKLGTKVSVVELTPQLLPGVDTDLVRVVEKAFKAAGGQVYLGAKARGCATTASGASVTIELEGKTEKLETEVVLVAVGFRPNSSDLGLEAIGVKLDERGHILTNALLQSNVPSIYAIGDVSGGPYLAHKASKEGEIVAEVIAGHKAARDWRAMPAAIFTEPEIATVGLSEAQAAREGRTIRVGKFPFSVLGRAMAMRATEGFTKVIIDSETNEVLGVGIVGPEASDLISEAALAIEMCAFAEDVALTVHPHPTLGEGVMEAFKHALGEAVHIANR